MKNPALWPRWQWTLFAAALFLLVAGVISYPRLSHPAFGALGDVVFHYHFTRAYSQSLSEGDWLPRWAGWLSGGRGEALFTFYPPLCFFLTTVWQRVFHLDLLNALKLTVFGCFWLAQGSAYAFARLFFERWASVLAAVVFVFLPAYPFVTHNRGLLPNALALSFLPLVLRAAYQLIHHENSRGALALFALSVSLIIATHVITVYLCALAVTFLLLADWRALRWQSFRNLALASIAAFALNAVWLVPQLLEINWVNVKLLTEQHDYRNYFLFAKAASDSAFHQAWARLNQAASLFTVLQTALAFLLVVSLWRAPVTERLRGLNFYALALTAFGLVIALPWFGWLWAWLPGLPYLQFPWRWQPLVALACGWLLAALWETNKALYRKLALWLLLLGASNVYFSYNVTRMPALPVDHATLLQSFDRTDLPAVTTEELRAAQTREGFDYLTYFGNQPSYRPRNSEIVLYPSAKQYGGLRYLRGSGEIAFQELQNQLRVFSLRNSTDARVQLGTYAYPHWVARLDGVEKPIQTEASLGLIEVEVPAGNHQLQFTYEVRHPLLKGARLLSVVAWAVFALSLAAFGIGRLRAKNAA